MAALLVVAIASVATADPDGGVPAIWQRCEELRPDAGDVSVELDGGWLMLSPARARFDACRLGAAGKCSELLGHVDAGVSAPEDHAALHLVTAIVSGAASVFSAYAADRTARRLPLWPP